MHVLLVEPSATIAAALAQALERGRVTCTLTADPAELDDLSGFGAILVGGLADAPATVEALRRQGFNGPMLALLDGRSVEQTVKLLSAGCDDVVLKPISPMEIKARVQAVVRRGFGHATAAIRIGEITAYLDGRDPEVDGKRLRLSHREHAIFTHLALQVGKVVSKDTIYGAVYGLMQSQPFDKVIDVYICKLRKKIETATGGHKYIETVYGRGYKLAAPEGEALHH